MKKTCFTIAFLSVLLFYPMLLGKTLFFGDNYSLLVPGKIFTAINLRQGRLPLWNPYLFLGQSWIGNLNESVLYPSTLFFVVFNPSTALSLTIVLHTILSGVGAYLLSKVFIKQEWARLCAVSLWILSAQWIATLGNISVIQSASFIPLVILACIKLQRNVASILTLSLLIVAQIAGGYPQYTLYSVLFGFVLHIYVNRTAGKKKRSVHALQFLLAGLSAFLLSSMYWMPFLSLLHLSTRTIQSTQQVTAGSLHPLELVNIFVPTIFDDPSTGMKWGPLWNRGVATGLYVPLFGLCAIIWVYRHRRTMFDRYALWITLGSLGIAMLGFFGISPLQFLPLFSSSRGAGLILLPATLVLAIWIGSAFERLVIQETTFAKLKWIFSSLFICSFVGLMSVHFLFPSIWNGVNQFLHGKLSSGWHTLERDQVIVTSILSHLTFQLLSFLIMALALKRKKMWFFLIVVIIDMRIAVVGRIMYAPAAIYPTWSEIQSDSDKALLRAQGNDRVLIANGNSPYTDFATYWDALTVRQPFSDSYIDVSELTTHARLQEMRQGYTPDWNMTYGIRSLNGYAAFVPKDLDQIFNQTREPSLNNLPYILPLDPHVSQFGVNTYWLDTWYPNSQTSDSPQLQSTHGAYKLFSMPTLGRFRLSEEISTRFSIQENPNEQEIRFTSPKQASLLIADSYNPNWQATVNGNSVPIENLGSIRKIPIEKGENEVVLRYVPKEFYIGLIISSFTLLGMLILLYRHRRLL